MRGTAEIFAREQGVGEKIPLARTLGIEYTIP